MLYGLWSNPKECFNVYTSLNAFIKILESHCAEQVLLLKIDKMYIIVNDAQYFSIFISILRF